MLQQSNKFLFICNNHGLLNGIEMLYLTKYNITCCSGTGREYEILYPLIDLELINPSSIVQYQEDLSGTP